MTNLPTGTVTFLFTDIEGSTTLAQQYPDELPALLARHHALLHQAIERHQRSRLSNHRRCILRRIPHGGRCARRGGGGAARLAARSVGSCSDQSPHGHPHRRGAGRRD